MRFIAIPILGLIVILFFRTMDQPPVEPEQKPEFRTSATFLYQTFHADSLVADKKYRDKVIQVSGQVTRIEQDDSGQVALILQGDPSRLSGVECLLHQSQIQRIRQLQSGQRVIVKGYGGEKGACPAEAACWFTRPRRPRSRHPRLGYPPCVSPISLDRTSYGGF